MKTIVDKTPCRFILYYRKSDIYVIFFKKDNISLWCTKRNLRWIIVCDSRFILNFSSYLCVCIMGGSHRFSGFIAKRKFLHKKIITNVRLIRFVDVFFWDPGEQTKTYVHTMHDLQF